MTRQTKLTLLTCLLALVTTAYADNASAPAQQQACPGKEQTATGRRILQNQALGKALDKNPLGIAMARRAKKKHLDEAEDCPS